MAGFGNHGMADFQKTELESRWKKCKDLMNQKGIDTLFLSHWANIAYFSGFRQTYYNDVCYIFILPADGEPVLVAPISMRGNIENMTWLPKVRYFGKDVGGDATHVVLDVFKDLRRKKTVGAEIEGIEVGGGMLNSAPYTLDAARKGSGEFDVVDCSEIVWRLRKIKSQQETEYIRKSAEICNAAFRTALESLRVGMTEREYAGIVYKAMIDGGATDTPLYGTLNCRAGSDRYTHFDTRPTDRKIGKGEIVMLDGGTTFRGYWSDITRQACVGEPSKKQGELHKMAQKATEAGVEAVRPGATAQEICDAALGAVRKAGFGQYLISEGIGHALGLQIHEPPWLRSAIQEKLEPGMVIALEPTLYDTPIADYLRYKPGASGLGGEGIFAVEDNVLVTNSGHEDLTTLPRELWIAR